MQNGGIVISMNHSESTADIVNELENMEKDICNLPLIFAEMFKDEVNANDEQKMYNGIKRIVRKYAQDHKSMSAINEFARVICGGASLDEILQISKDEAVNPTVETDLTVDSECRLK